MPGLTLLQKIVLLMAIGDSEPWKVDDICLMLDCDRGRCAFSLDFLRKVGLVNKIFNEYQPNGLLKQEAMGIKERHNG